LCLRHRLPAPHVCHGSILLRAVGVATSIHFQTWHPMSHRYPPPKNSRPLKTIPVT
jgi:hypothetical protein